MEDKYQHQQHEGCTSPPQDRRDQRPEIRDQRPETRDQRSETIAASASLHQKTTMPSGYLPLLVLGLWAELAVGRFLPTVKTDQMQSIIDDLQAALQEYSSCLKESNYLGVLPVHPCTEDDPLSQNDTVADKLAHYQVYAEKLPLFCPEARCQVIILNQDLLQHLGSNQDSEGCGPSSSSHPPSSSSPPSDFTSVHESIQHILCWGQQVGALRR